MGKLAAVADPEKKPSGLKPHLTSHISHLTSTPLTSWSILYFNAFSSRVQSSIEGMRRPRIASGTSSS